MSLANCGMQDEKAPECDAGGNTEEKGAQARPLSRTRVNRAKKVP